MDAMDHSRDPRSRGCQGINEETGDVCGETSTLRILDEFRKLYEDRIRKISEETDGSSEHTKLKIMEEWVKDLGEQNAMLVRTVEELEHEAANRVILLEEKLQQSAATVANITLSNMGEDGSMAVLENRVSQLKKDEETLQQKIEFLQSDIRGLLELIRRARTENCWSLDGITFFEIQSSDIPAPLDCTCGQEKEDAAEYIASLKEQVEQLKENEKQAIAYQTGLEEKLAEQNNQVVLKEETIKKYISKLQTLRDNLKNRSKLANQIVLGSTSPSIDLDSDIVRMADIMENALDTSEIKIENLRQQLQESETKFSKLMHEKSSDMDNLQSQLDQKCMELQQTEYRMNCLQKESLETRDALTVEVAEKHDLVISLRKELAHLEEQCRQSDMQTHFKDDIIKEMRRELKQAKSKETCSSSRRVRIKTESSAERCSSYSGTTCSSSKSDEISMRDRLHETQNRLKNVRNTLMQRNNEISKLKNELNGQKIKSMELYRKLEKLGVKNIKKYQEDDTIDGNAPSHHQGEILVYLSNTKVLMEKEREALLGLKTELLRMLEDISVKEAEDINRDNGIGNIQKQLLEIEKLLFNYKAEIIDHSKSMEIMRNNRDAVEARITYLHDLLQTASCANTNNEVTLQNMKSLLADLRFTKSSKDTCCSSSNTLLNGLEAVLKHLSNVLEITERCACIDDGEKIHMKSLKKRVANSVENISRIYKDKEKAIGLMRTVAKKCKDDYAPAKASAVVNNEAIQHFRMMEEFRVCTVEAQAATEDLREEMTNVICSLNCRHEKFTEFTKLVQQIQDHLTKTRENLSETINQLKLQEQEKLRHSERITNGATKLKDMKNEMNQIKSDISRCIGNASDNSQEYSSIGIVKVHTCDDLLTMVNEEIQQIITNVQIYQTGACNAVTMLLEVKGQLNRLEDCLRDLQKKADEVLIDNEMAQNVFMERSKKLDRLEQELDNTHTKMQDMLENFASVMEQMSTGNPRDLGDQNHSNYCSQDILSKSKQDDLFRIKDELRKVQKEYEDLKIKTSLEICQAQKQEKVNEWKCRVADLQDQIRELQNEAKCETASNEFLKKKIETMEKEISSAEMKVQTQRRCLSSDSAELKSRIFELECSAMKNKEKEDLLRRDLDCSEIELKKSRDLLSSYSQYKSDGMYYTCSQDFRYENIPQSFKVLQDTMQSARIGLEELSNELKKLVCEGSSHSTLSSGSFSAAMDMLKKYGETTEQCSAEVEKLRNALCSKDKLLGNKEEIIRIQKDSIKMTQAELKDLHQKLQEKDQHKEKVLEDLQLVQSELQLQTKVITELERERAHLEKENELQIQTIGNLQEAVVEAKRRLDQMGNRAASELNDKDEAIQLLTLYLNETQYQYSECFQEAAKQDTVLEFQREAVDQLRLKIKNMDNSVIVNNLHCTYFAVLSAIQEQLQDRCKEFEAIKAKMETLIKSKNCLEDKYKNMKKLWQEADQEQRELKSILTKTENDMKYCQTEINKCKADMEDKDCTTQDLICKLTLKDESMKEMEGSHCIKVKDYEDLLKKSENIERQLRNKILVLKERDKDMKQQIQKYKMDLEIFDKELRSERKANTNIQQLQSENELLKKELGDHTRETEALIHEIEAMKDKEICLKKELEEKQRVESVVVKDELQKCNCDLVKLSTEAKVKEEELKILKEFKKELERTEELKSINENLRKDFEILRLDDKNTQLKFMKCSETVARLHDDIDLKKQEMKELCDQLKRFEEVKVQNSQIIEHLEEQLQLSEDRTEECLRELNVSKEMLAVLRDRVCSLKGILQEKSDDMVKLQADHQILKNANSILKAEQSIYENKAREDISELKKRLKGVQIQLSLMEDNYHRVTQDFNKSQDLLVDATKREVDLQHAITAMESNLLSKLSVAEKEERRLGDIVDKLSEELEDTRGELSSKNSQLCQAQCRNKCYANQLASVQQECQEHRDTIDASRMTIDKLELKINELMCSKDTESSHLRTKIDNHTTCTIGDGVNKRLSLELAKVQTELGTKACKESAMQFEIQSLQEKLLKSEEVKCCLSTQLQQCLQENCDLAAKKSLLEQNNCKCLSELQDMHKSLLELRQECQVKTKSLVSMSAELSQVAVSRSELCTESQYVVLCIRAWMDEQKNLVETLASKLNVKQQQVMQLAFEKKALLATIRELRRANCALTQRMKRLHKPSVCGRGSRSLYSGCKTSPPSISNLSNSRSGPSSCSFSRKSSLGPIRNVRRTTVCGHSWWFPKMDHLTKELRKNNQWWNKNTIDRTESDPGLDESRDCGYQSSTSK